MVVAVEVVVVKVEVKTSVSVLTATVVVDVCVTVAVVVVVDAVRYVVLPVTPKQEHALEYLAVPEHGEAYAGMAVGVRVMARRSSSATFLFCALGAT